MKRIKYYINNPVNRGTEEAPVVKNNLFLKDIPYSEANEEIAKKEAYNGDYTIEDDGQPEPEPAETGDVVTWAALNAAYQEGVDSV